HRHRSVWPGQQLYLATLDLDFPLAVQFAFESVDGNSLTGNWAAIEIECECKAQRCLAQKRGESFKREEGVRRGSQDDPAVSVMAHKAAIGEPPAGGHHKVCSMFREEKRIGHHRIMSAAEGLLPTLMGEVADPDERIGR